MKTLNVGLLLDSVHSDKYVEELALWGKSRPEINISHLILHPYREGRLRLLPSRAVFQVILWVERMLLRWSGRHKDHYAVRDLTKIVQRIVQIRPIVSASGHECRFADEDVEKIKALDLDLLISCGARIPRGAILGASRLGVIACFHGGFWECYRRWPQTSFAIRRLSEGAGIGDELASGSFRTRFYYSVNKANVYKKSVGHLKNLLKTVALSGELPSSDRARPYPSDACRAPNLLECLVYACKLLRRISIKAAARMPMLRERFGISVLRGKWDQSMSWRTAAASLARGRPGVFHGSLSYLLQDANGQVQPAHSVSAGLDYPGVGPEHAYLKDTGRVLYVAVTDQEALAAFAGLSRLEGILPALESAHAVAWVLGRREHWRAGDLVLINLSGRGDKDVAMVAELTGAKL